MVSPAQGQSSSTAAGSIVSPLVLLVAVVVDVVSAVVKVVATAAAVVFVVGIVTATIATENSICCPCRWWRSRW
jgi:hypothetical protein